jgi:uncharacterized protein YyaL (SSP411 family)
MPSFGRVLASVADAWQNRRADVERTVDQVTDYLRDRMTRPAQEQVLLPSIFDRAASALAHQFDALNGGFGRAPKFPQPMILDFLLRYHQRTGDTKSLAMVERTLQKMARGGVYDQLGGGFHRYSVDAIWLVPHFEKMLYDNAQLATAYLAAYQVTGNAFYQRVVEETLDYVLREMTSPDGGFYATQDADSEGEEGKFYVWSASEIRQALGPDDAKLFELAYGVTERGNFERHHNILFRAREPDEVATVAGVSAEAAEAAIARGRAILFERRSHRVWPGRDEKILTAWNGLMIRGFADAGRVLKRADYVGAAVRAATFVLDKLGSKGRLLRSYKDNIAKLNGYLEDYAFLADGLLALYAATFDPRWFAEAHGLGDVMLTWFWDDRIGAFFDTSADHEALVTRPRDVYDNATPAGNSVAAQVLLRLADYLGDDALRQRARSILSPFGEAMAEHPLAFGRLVGALDDCLAETQEVAIVGDPSAPESGALLEVVNAHFRPHVAVAFKRSEDQDVERLIPLLADRPMLGGQATAYVCRNFACQLPTTAPDELERQLAHRPS